MKLVGVALARASANPLSAAATTAAPASAPHASVAAHAAPGDTASPARLAPMPASRPASPGTLPARSPRSSASSSSRVNWRCASSRMVSISMPTLATATIAIVVAIVPSTVCSSHRTAAAKGRSPMGSGRYPAAVSINMRERSCHPRAIVPHAVNLACPARHVDELGSRPGRKMARARAQDHSVEPPITNRTSGSRLLRDARAAFTRALNVRSGIVTDCHFRSV